MRKSLTQVIGFPFSAIVGNDDYKTALLANAVDPGIGGVLAIGERGTAKSTVARAVAALLPDREITVGCAYGCAPAAPFAECPDGPHTGERSAKVPARLVELPVGATLDRLLGGFDLGEALTGGEVRFAPGLLAAANRNILYVDEVNLLADHLVDALLDAAASGVNRVERDGVGATHAARFVLVGTMNPEEGDLRPQFLDRFGLAVSVTASREPGVRAEVVRRRMAFERDPEAFAAAWLERDARLRSRVARARENVAALDIGAGQLDYIASVCAGLGVEGLRADIVAARTACALAALDACGEVADEHVRQALMLALPHRVADPLHESAAEAIVRVAAALSEAGGMLPDAAEQRPRFTGVAPLEAPALGELKISPRAAKADSKPQRLDSGLAGRSRRRQAGTGARIDAIPTGDDGDGDGVDVQASLAAAARRAPHTSGVTIEVRDLRRSIAAGNEQSLVVLAVDTSASLISALGQDGVERLLGELLGEAQARRDRVAVVAFGGEGASQVTPPTRNRALVASLLARLPPGGTTPLAAGIEAAADFVRRERARHPGGRIVTLLVTDGRANVAQAGGDPFTEALGQADRLRALETDCYVIADDRWQARRLCERAGGKLVDPWWDAASARPARAAAER